MPTPPVRTAPWEHNWAPLLAGLDGQYESIRKEVMGTMDSIVWKGSGNDLRLSSNDYWDPHTSWDAVSLFLLF